MKFNFDIINNIKNMTTKSTSGMYIQDYSPKSFVIRGNSKEYHLEIKGMGGKWCANLTDKNTNENFSGWIFFIDKKRDVERWLCLKDEEVSCGKVIKKIEVKKTESTSEDFEELLRNIKTMKVAIEKMEARVESYIKNKIESPKQKEDNSDIESEEESEEKKKIKEKPKRLLKK